MASVQNPTISGFLYSEQMQWSRLWFVVFNKFLLQFADKTSQQPQCGMPLLGTVVRLETNCPRPHCFSIRCAAGVVVLSAETDQEAAEWVNAINKEIGNAPVQAAAPQQTPSQPVAVPAQQTPSCVAGLASPPSNTGVVGSPQKVQSVPSSAGTPSSPQTLAGASENSPANDISPESFWSKAFGKLEEAPWPKLVDELCNALDFDLRSEAYYAPFYCIANVVAEGSLTLRNSISRTNFRLFVALFGPLSACAAKCKELIDAGIFHGEITSQEADERLKAVDAVGGYLVRLRKGSRHQIALAFMDSQKVTKHILLDVNQNAYCIHQLPAVFSSIPKLVFAYRSKFIQAVSYPLMNQFGPNATSANLVGLASGSSAQSAASASGGVSSPKANTNVTDIKGMSFADLEALFAAIASEANTIVANRQLQLLPGATEATLMERGRQLMNDLEIAKQHILALAMAEKPFAVDPSLGAGPSNAGYLQQVLSKVKPQIVCNIRVPVLELEGKRILPGTCDRQEALDKILRKAAVENVQQLGLYLPASGVWTDPKRPLSSYLLVPEDRIDVLFLPQQENPCVVSVKNTLTGQMESVPIDDHTTIFGLIQAVTKPDPERIAQSGIRIRTAAGSFFCDPTKLCTDYQVGLSIKNVEYGVVSVGEQFVQPKFAPLDKVQPLIAASVSTLANVPTIKQLSLQVVETQRLLQMLKSGAVPPAVPASSPVSSSTAPASSSTAPVSSSVNSHGSATAVEHFKEHDDHSLPKPYNALPAVQNDLSPMALPQQLLELPASASANGSVVYGIQINVPSVPEPDADLVNNTKWMMDVAYLGTWWSSLSVDQRHNNDNIERARSLVRNLFEDTSKATKTQRMALLTQAAFSKEQLAAITQCLSDVASH